jgi:hypothetical protein
MPEKDERSLLHATAVIKLLLSMASDRWFEWSWTLQKNQCAASLFLLVPIPPDMEFPDKGKLKEKFRPPIVGNDLCADLASIQRHWSNKELFSDFYNIEFSVEKGYSDGFQGLWVLIHARFCSLDTRIRNPCGSFTVPASR